MSEPGRDRRDLIGLATLLLTALGFGWAVWGDGARGPDEVLVVFTTPESLPERGVLALGEDGLDRLPDERGLLWISGQRGRSMDVLEATTRRRLARFEVTAARRQEVQVTR